MRPPHDLSKQVSGATRNFQWKEFSCRCGGVSCDGFPDDVTPLIELTENIQILRNLVNYAVLTLPGIRDAIRFKVSSGYRDPVHNASIGGSTDSYHMRIMAADIWPYYANAGFKVDGTPARLLAPRIVSQLAWMSGLFGCVICYSWGVHLDTRHVPYIKGFTPAL